MSDLIESHIHCPYCGEGLSILIDPYELEQEYIEDCQVCCRPMVIFVDAGLNIAVRQEDDVGFE